MTWSSSGDVGGDRDELVARGTCLLDGRLVGLSPPARDGDPGARLREAERERLAEALVAAGDQGGLAVEAERRGHAVTIDMICHRVR